MVFTSACAGHVWSLTHQASNLPHQSFHCNAMQRLKPGIILQLGNTADPEDQVQRLWHKQLQAVVDWMLPECSADSLTDHSPDNTLPRRPAVDQTPLQQCVTHTPEAVAVHSTSDHPTCMSVEEDNLLDGESFDAAELYTAVKPSGNEPQLPQDNPKLRPTLRPYQRRAAAWMVARETGAWVRPHGCSQETH